MKIHSRPWYILLIAAISVLVPLYILGRNLLLPGRILNAILRDPFLNAPVFTLYLLYVIAGVGLLLGKPFSRYLYFAASVIASIAALAMAVIIFVPGLGFASTVPTPIFAVLSGVAMIGAVPWIPTFFVFRHFRLTAGSRGDAPQSARA